MPHLMQKISKSSGVAYSAFYDTGNAQVFISRDGGQQAGIDTLNGRRRGHLPKDLDSSLTDAGFRDGGLQAMSPSLRALHDVERLDVAFNVVSRHHLVECINARGWVGGLQQSRRQP
ncbi:hypothetical protein ACFVT5_15410 [Streptomyces sp. NPDC058001]|uniref:hypothetical protein n=1 Tax=Streptomyces sp. NPDC058001 TaxID=3346300 RepID=UPI0036E410E3